MCALEQALFTAGECASAAVGGGLFDVVGLGARQAAACLAVLGAGACAWWVAYALRHEACSDAGGSTNGGGNDGVALPTKAGGAGPAEGAA